MTPTRNRSTPPAAFATTPTTWPPTVEALGLPPAHVVGWSLGGGVVLQYLLDAPDADRVTDAGGPGVARSVSAAPAGSTACCPTRPGPGTGGGQREPRVRRAVGRQDRSGDTALSPRQVLLAHYVKPPFVPEHLDIFVESMLSTRLGEDHYPGDSTTVAAWPGFAPGQPGVC